jgi:hypothetical protein
MSEDRQAAIKALEEKHNLYKRVFESEDGAKVLADIEKDCWIKGSTFSTEALTMAFREGMRCVVLHIKTLVELNTQEMRNASKEEANEEEGR